MGIEKIVADAVAGALAARLDAIEKKLEQLGAVGKEGDSSPEYMSRKEVAEYLGVCLATVDNYSRQGLLTKRYFGSVPRFHRDEVRQVMNGLKK